jgi:hypothetical protein
VGEEPAVSARLAWSIFAACVLLSAAGVALLAQVPAVALERAGNSFVLSTLFVVVLLVFGLVGAVVASRLPGNPIGWLFLALAALEATYELAFGWTHYTLNADPGALPGAAYTAWVADWTSPLSPPALVLVLLLFPDGRLVSRRWRYVAWLCLPLLLLIVVDYALAPGPISEFPSVTNPVALEGAGWLANVESEPFVFALLCAAVASLVVRFRRSRGSERQQLKWFAYAGGLMATYLLVSSVLLAVVGDEAGDESYLAGFLFAAVLSTLPVAAGVAILRYRLYDIDVVINRTLVYGALTATLAGAYLGCVLLFQLLLSPLTEDSDLAIAGSTLAVAGLFGPARARIQAAVDHRFYRRRYDAARTLEAFGGRLREQLDLEALAGDLRGVVRETVQPAHVSLWLRRPR